MAGTLTLRVITPGSVAFDAEVESVVLPGLDGKLGVLPRHATLVTALDLGELTFKRGGREESMFVAGGFAEVRRDTLRVVTEAGEEGRTIDATRAEAARARAEERLQQGAPELDRVRAEAALRRALMRLTVARTRGHSA